MAKIGIGGFVLWRQQMDAMEIRPGNEV